MRSLKLTPVSMRIVHYNKWGDWEVYQDFLRLGEYRVRVYACGPTRELALEYFEREFYYAAELKPFHPIDSLCGLLWDIAGIIDTVSRRIK